MKERAHRQLKDALLSCLAAAISCPIPMGPFGTYCGAAPKEDSGISSAELLLGFLLQLPGKIDQPVGNIYGDFVEQAKK